MTNMNWHTFCLMWDVMFSLLIFYFSHDCGWGDWYFSIKVHTWDLREYTFKNKWRNILLWFSKNILKEWNYNLQSHLLNLLENLVKTTTTTKQNPKLFRDSTSCKNISNYRVIAVHNKSMIKMLLQNQQQERLIWSSGSHSLVSIRTIGKCHNVGSWAPSLKAPIPISEDKGVA